MVNSASTPAAWVLSGMGLHLQRQHDAQVQVILSGDEHCDLHLQRGQLCHLTGRSGSGKSTLLWALARLYPLAAGTLSWQGQAASTVNVLEWRCHIGLLPQTPILLAGSIADNLCYAARHLSQQTHRFKMRNIATDDVVLDTLLTRLGLQVPLNRPANALSGGQQARLALARLLLTQPDVILADEPLAGLDADSAAQVMAVLHTFCAEGGAVLMTAHTHATLVKPHSRYDILPTRRLESHS